MTNDEPLGLPKGSVRAIITLLLTIFILYSKMKKIELDSNIISLWSASIGFYIGARMS